MKQLTKRQQHIFNTISQRGALSNLEIKSAVEPIFGHISRITIIRDIEVLLEEGVIRKLGAGRSIKYIPAKETPLFQPFDVTHYFEIDPDVRAIKSTFNFDVFSQFGNLFSKNELAHLEKLTQDFRKNYRKLSPELYRKEVQRLAIELSWKSSQIEGNTYTLLDTEALIQDNIRAPGHSEEEAIMILNHKKTIDYIFSVPQEYTSFSIRKIEDIHRVLVTNLNIDFGLRNQLVRIVGTAFKPLDNVFQITEALTHCINVVNQYLDPFHKAMAMILLLSYIQPFLDGNKRTARLCGNAILLAHDACPLSYRSVNPVEYKKAMLLFYEQNSLLYFKELFMSQVEFSVKNYFTT